MKRERNPVAEMVVAIKGFGDGFVRIERMKMEMAREVEAIRRDMEMKWTKMILESQEQIVEPLERLYQRRETRRLRECQGQKLGFWAAKGIAEKNAFSGVVELSEAGKLGFA